MDRVSENRLHGFFREACFLFLHGSLKPELTVLSEESIHTLIPVNDRYHALHTNPVSAYGGDRDIVFEDRGRCIAV